MLSCYHLENNRLQAGPLPESVSGMAWFDLLNPTMDEEKSLEALLGIEFPSHDDMMEIELSSRLYQEDGGIFMTALLPAQADGDYPVMAPVTFVLHGSILVTIRYHSPRAFQAFVTRAEKSAVDIKDGQTVMLALLEFIVDRLADVLERAGRELDAIARGVFGGGKGSRPRPDRDYRNILEEIGRKGDLTSNIRDSLASLARISSYLGQLTLRNRSAKDVREQVKALARDVQSLSDHVGFMSQKVTFLLDATLGLINIEQNAIIKIFSVAAVVFLPPTLVASIYGMNFQFMPELALPFGYPMALVMMVLSSVLPYLYFRRRGWL